MSCGQSSGNCNSCSTSDFDPGRRDFLKTSATAAGVTLATGVTLYAVGAAPAVKAEEPVSDKVRWGMLVDVNRCNKGCDACVSACHKENGVTDHDRPLTDPQWIRKIEVTDPISGFEKSLPMMCQHCAEPPCVDVCPTGASFKRADGIVLVDKHICIGCRYCMMACPYKARSFVHETLEDQKPHAPRGKGTVESCTMCVHRVDEGQSPACVDACKEVGAEAILFGDLNDPNSEISKRIASYGATEVRADLGLNLGVKYQNL